MRTCSVHQSQRPASLQHPALAPLPGSCHSGSVTLFDLPTPSIVLDRSILERNCARMAQRAAQQGVRLRPHLKTAKCTRVAEMTAPLPGGSITVSTVAEAEYFAHAGWKDITWAVGLAPGKTAACAMIQKCFGARVNLLVDHPETARQLTRIASDLGADFHVFIEVDSGEGRGGVSPLDSPLILEIARALESPRVRLAGVLTHAGHSYRCSSREGIVEVAKQERIAVVQAATVLRHAGFACPTVSAGSSPTATFGEDWTGVTELRPGVYTLFDLVMWALGVCTLEDIAATVLATVIGHNHRAGRILIDAGSLALSKDIGTNQLRPGVGYGLVAAVPARKPCRFLRIAEAYQEHGLIAAEGEMPWEAFPIGSRVRVWPNHACLTVAPYREFHVIEHGGSEVVDRWEKLGSGW